MRDETWTMRDGTKIKVGDMDENHVRNALRMVIRQARRRKLRAALDVIRPEYEMTVGEMQDELSARAYQDLKNPGAYFPYLDGGVHGSQSLYEKYGRKG